MAVILTQEGQLERVIRVYPLRDQQTGRHTVTSRYLIGLGLAFVLIGAVLTTTVVAGALLTGHSPQINGVGGAWLAFSIPTVPSLAFVVGPGILIARRRLGPGLTAVRAAAIGATTGPVALFVVWLLFREGDETISGLLLFWSRLPLEFVLGAVPHAAAGALFAGWLVHGQTAAHRRPA
jgi:hypothetical protein